MPIIFKFFIDLACGVLGAWGGGGFLAARRFIMPCVLGVAISFFTHTWWAGLLILPMMGTLCLGYANTGHWWRGMWAFIQAVVAGIGLTWTHHLAWWLFAPYCVLSGVLGGLYVNWEQWFGDICLYGYLGSIVFLVH
jgi:hypothetical protein